MLFPDTWDPMMRIGREIKMLAPYYLAGDADTFQRILTEEGKPDWDLASVVSPECALLFANDLAYRPDVADSTFHFGEPRECSHWFRLPTWLREPADVFRVDADGVHPVVWKVEQNGVRIDHRCSRDAVFVVARTGRVRKEIEERRGAAIRWEEQHPVELEALTELSRSASAK